MTINTNIKPRKCWDFRDLVKWILTNYYNHNNVTINIYYNDKICDKFSTSDIKIDAILEQLTIPHTYNLLVREYSDLKTIICHELIHLDQYERGDLKVVRLENTTLFRWKNEDYDSNTPYNDRPWEKEAHDLDGKLWKEYKKYKKQKGAK